MRVHEYCEHYNGSIPEDRFLPKRIDFKGRRDRDSACLEIYDENGQRKLRLSYYIGLDWLNDKDAIYVNPKVSSDSGWVDYLGMLSTCLQHPDVVEETEDLYQIDFTQPRIEIEASKDILTPLLVVHFLQVVRIIVKKGLRKDYYPVQRNLNSRLKGKVLSGKNIKQNVFNNQFLKTLCAYDEFGFDTPENRTIKRTLRFIQRYSGQQPALQRGVEPFLKLCLPAFDSVSEAPEVGANKSLKWNALYREYGVALRLSRLILKHLGYNIRPENASGKVSVPPFWIDMSCLFELYVLAKLRDRFNDGVKYHFKRQWNELDYLVNTPGYKVVVDAKYKLRYSHTYGIDDLRQVSGYARLSAVSEELGKSNEELIDCLIVYPDQKAGVELPEDLLSDSISGFNRIFKAAIRLPVQMDSYF